ncbi:mitochondrial inner membrane protease subunit 2 isoform X5 [Canis lupus baileyi]|nr:mitochondrial inner membrane protease subunit 2 isoform X4 [Canis lupus familiaris]XP_038413297.1 mitochondrial inner membrane protease subunit 2 isoform X4 [Canis lupus familiaris]XP_038542928.1 mitochondrial inner membrane protease subunit 2 isoform X4 [Canis lupus familiaris]
MAQSQGWVRRYAKAFCKGFFVAVPVAVTFLDRVACVARVEGASMQPSLNPGGSQSSDVVLLNHWKVRNFEVQRGDIVSLVLHSHLVGDGEDTHPSERGHTVSRQLCSFFFFFQEKHADYLEAGKFE